MLRPRALGPLVETSFRLGRTYWGRGRKGCLRVRAARDLNRPRRPLRVPGNVRRSTAPAAKCSPALQPPGRGSGIEEASRGARSEATCAEWIHGALNLPRPRGSARRESQARSIDRSSTASSPEPPAKRGSDDQGFQSSSRGPRRRRRWSPTGSCPIGLATARSPYASRAKASSRAGSTAGSPQRPPRRSHPP